MRAVSSRTSPKSGYNLHVKKITCSCLILAALSGCAAMPSTGSATLVVRPQFGYQSLTQVLPYAQGDINHLTIKLLTSSEQDLGISKDIPNADLGKTVVFSNLKDNRTYRIRAYAYLTSGTTQCISNDAGSYVDVTVGTDNQPALTALKVKLIDKGFNGIGTSSLAVTPGGYSYAGTESFDVVTAVSTLAGSGGTGVANGSALASDIYGPTGITTDGAGIIYFADTNNRIRKLDRNTQLVSNVAGDGIPGPQDGPAAAARFNAPEGLAYWNHQLLVADPGNNAIRKVDLNAMTVSTYAGTCNPGFQNGAATVAMFDYPQGVAVDSTGNLYVADAGNNRIRRVDVVTKEVTTLAGSGAVGSANGAAGDATFNWPTGVALDSQGNVYVADEGNSQIRKIAASDHQVTTYAGSGVFDYLDGPAATACFNYPYALAVDPLGGLCVADQRNHRIRRIDPVTKVVSTLAGDGNNRFLDGSPLSASFYHPYGIVFDPQGRLFISDYHNNRLRMWN